jgi:hypothetical protein
MGKIILINGRFELLNRPDRVDIFDIRNLKRDDAGRVNPVAAIPLEGPKSCLEAGKLALRKLRDSDYITQSEYYHFLDVFLAVQPEAESAALRDQLAGNPDSGRTGNPNSGL